MRKVYLDKLPRLYHRDDYIDWKNSIGQKVKFVYDDVEGEIKICDYNIKSQKLTIEYDKSIFNIGIKNFKKCCIGIIIGKKNLLYKYNIGDIVNGLRILKQIRIKYGKHTKRGYVVKCIKDGYVHEKCETSLSAGQGCPVCDNKIAVKGVNDIATTHPNLIKYFVDTEDAYVNSYGSNKRALFKCPNCKYEKRMNIAVLIRNGIMCPKCSDGKSYPEKFVFSLLEQLGIDFEIEKRFDWAKNKRYDFYIPSLNCIIETHGEQHYINYGGKWDKLEVIQKNDELKYQLALSNNNKHYIALDCKKSNIEHIKNSVLNSELNKLFDLTKIDWLKCHKFACSSRVKEACDLWNSGIKNTTNICKIMNMSRTAVLKYLKRGAELEWCDYNAIEVQLRNNKQNAKRNEKVLGKKCKVTLSGKDIVYPTKLKCLKDNDFGERIFDKLVKSKEPFKPNPRYHKHLMHLEGMRIEYM